MDHLHVKNFCDATYLLPAFFQHNTIVIVYSSMRSLCKAALRFTSLSVVVVGLTLVAFIDRGQKEILGSKNIKFGI